MFYEVLKLCRRTVYFGSIYTIWIYIHYGSIRKCMHHSCILLFASSTNVPQSRISDSIDKETTRFSSIVDFESFTKIGTPFVDDHFHHVHGILTARNATNTRRRCREKAGKTMMDDWEVGCWYHAGCYTGVEEVKHLPVTSGCCIF